MLKQTQVHTIMRKLKQAQIIEEESRPDLEKMHTLDSYYYERFVQESGHQGLDVRTILQQEEESPAKKAAQTTTTQFLRQSPKTKSMDRSGYKYRAHPLLTFINLDETKSTKQLKSRQDRVKNLHQTYQTKEKELVMKRVLHQGYWRYKKTDFRTQEEVEVIR